MTAPLLPLLPGPVTDMRISRANEAAAAAVNELSRATITPIFQASLTSPVLLPFVVLLVIPPMLVLGFPAGRRSSSGPPLESPSDDPEAILEMNASELGDADRLGSLDKDESEEADCSSIRESEADELGCRDIDMSRSPGLLRLRTGVRPEDKRDDNDEVKDEDEADEINEPEKGSEEPPATPDAEETDDEGVLEAAVGAAK